MVQTPKLTAAQIQNRRFSIYIKNLAISTEQKHSKETEAVKQLIYRKLNPIGLVTSVSVDGQRKSAIVRFKDIDTAEKAFQ